MTGDPEFGAAVLQQIGDSIVGQCGIDRYECGTCGEHGQRRGHRIHAPRQEHRNLTAGADPMGKEHARQPVHALGEFVVAQGGFAVDERRDVRVGGPDPGEQIGHGLCDGRERSASGYQPGTTVGVEDVEPGDTSTGRSPGQCRQNGTQSPVVAVEVVRRVSIGVGLDVDSQIAAAGIDGKRQIVDRSGAQDVAAARAVPQRGLAPEHHDVDDGPEEAAVRDRPVRLPCHVLEPEPLMPQRPAEFGGDLRQVFRDSRVLTDLRPDRHHVRHHSARPAQQGVGARGHRQAQCHVVVAAHPGQIEGGRSGRHRRDGDIVVGAEGAHRVEKPLIEVAADAPRPGGRSGSRVTEPDRCGQVGKPAGPVFAVPLEPGRRPVGEVVGI